MKRMRGKRKVTKRCPMDGGYFIEPCKAGRCYYAKAYQAVQAGEGWATIMPRQIRCDERKKCTWYRRMVAKRRRAS